MAIKYFFSLLILVFSFSILPNENLNACCCDSKDKTEKVCDKDGKENTEKKACCSDKDEENPNSDCGGKCQDCVCHAVVQVLALPNVAFCFSTEKYTFTPELKERTTPLYRSSFLSNYQHDIWQPPQ